MNHEDRWQLQSSLAADGEIDHDEMLELLDQMAEDPSCREFWKQTRQLQELSTGLRVPQAAPSEATRWSWLWLAPTAVAAVIALLIFMPWSAPPVDSEAAIAPLEVRIAEDRGAMTEPRFIQLALEILRSDRRYQRKMADILEDVLPSPVDGDAENRGSGSSRFAEHSTFESAPALSELPYEAVASIH